MTLNKDQLEKLLTQVGATEDDALDCDGCYVHLAEFAEAELTGRELNEAMERVKRHLEQCPCCEDEFQALLAGLRALEEP